mmetsp:Transcript_4644/g.9884  ORF Transcript_4644/g.9884 Transcript_4644/m.9884 type:complete len:484 (-) Transcript_4644:124-1575(-)
MLLAFPCRHDLLSLATQGLRLRFVDALNQAVLTLGKDPTQAQLEACEAARLEFATTLAAVIASSSLSGPLSSSGELVNSGELGSGSKKAAARLADLLLDVEGQFKQAISRADWYKKWGRHYLPSLACAHLLQQCNNFKDPGVQHYGGSLFVFLRTAAEGIFVKLPPPEPSVVQAVVQATPMCRGSFSSMSAGGRAASASAVPVATRSRVDMSRYYDRGGGCFTGDALITLAVRGGAEEGGGEPATENANPEASPKDTKDTGVKRVKRVDQLRAGDQVKAFTRSSVDGKVTEGTGFVWFVAETLLSSPPLLVPVSSSSFSTTAGSSSSSSSSDDGGGNDCDYLVVSDEAQVHLRSILLFPTGRLKPATSTTRIRTQQAASEDVATVKKTSPSSEHGFLHQKEKRGIRVCQRESPRRRRQEVATEHRDVEMHNDSGMDSTWITGKSLRILFIVATCFLVFSFVPNSRFSAAALMVFGVCFLLHRC